MNDMEKTRRPLNRKQEKFAQMVAQGITATRAHVEAGYIDRGRNSKTNSSTVLKHPLVQARIAEIRKMADELGVTLMTIVEKRSFLAEVVRTPAGSVGLESRLCQGFYEKTKVRGKREGDGTTPEETAVIWRRVVMADKLRAIELDSKLAGHFPKTGAGVEDEEGEKGLDLEAIREIAERIKIVSPLLRERV
ncbi:terminase small subunit [Haloferula sp. BvORR071]|uniref:terminase small subunit n=1 Tax=Haloferula sp. BvORR071 TaxID=1396141 RepID=UPI002240F843|nr:terminase small subunit [Haloferula sp. BvORR071]